MQTNPKRKDPLPFMSPWGRSHPSSKFCRLEITLQAKLSGFGGGAVHPAFDSAGDEGCCCPRSFHTRTGALGRFCCLAGLRHTARCTHTGQPSICPQGNPSCRHHHLQLPFQAPRDGEDSSAAGKAGQERGAEMVKVAGK